MVCLSVLATVVACLCFAQSLDTSSSLTLSAHQLQCHAGDLSKLADLMPESVLPPPDSSPELQYVVLGIGTQNYTCASRHETTAPSTTGAVTKLYDIVPLLSNHGQAAWAISSISCLALALEFLAQPLELLLRINV